MLRDGPHTNLFPHCPYISNVSRFSARLRDGVIADGGSCN